VELSPSWDTAIEAILEDPGVTVVIGDVDSGKTTFTLQLANAALAAGVPTAVVDGDTGQAEIGPPAAISMATLDSPVQSLRELKPRRMYFVGSTTPVGNLLPTVVGARRMTDESLARGATLVVVDTSGLVKGLVGRRLKLHKVELLAPRHVVCIRKEREVDHIIAGLAKMERLRLHVLQASSEARAKPRDLRIQRRRAQFYEYFLNSERHIIRLDHIVCWGTYFTCGRPVRWQHYRTLERALKAKVLHAEVVGNGMYVVAECRPDMVGVAGLMEKNKTRDFTVVCGTDFSNVLVGLADSAANTMGLGIIEAVDFRQRHMVVITPIKTITPVRIVQFGAMRVKPDGTELGRIKPGEI
jgi:polynucleotide 5'-hydroxyl-kinase GRC3/NOL9